MLAILFGAVFGPLASGGSLGGWGQGGVWVPRPEMEGRRTQDKHPGLRMRRDEVGGCPIPSRAVGTNGEKELSFVCLLICVFTSSFA